MQGNALRHLTLNNKILLLLFGSTILVLFLVGSIFSLQVTQLHEKTARAALINSAELVRSDLLARRKHLRENSLRLVEDENILATLNLISRYQDRDNYQPLVFDPEKRRLVDLLEEPLHAGNLNMAALYQADGELIVFHADTALGESGGYQTFKDGTPQFVAVHGEASPHDGLQIYDKFGVLQRHSFTTEPVIKFRPAVGAANVVLEATIPYTLQQSGAGRMVIGWLRLAYYLDQDYIDTMALKLSVNLAFVADNNLVASSGFIPRHAELDHLNAPLMQLDAKGSTEVSWVEVANGYEAHLELPLEGDAHLHLVLGEGKSNLADNLHLFARSVFWVLLLAGALVVPLALYMTRHWVTGPIQLLTQVAHGITKGERPRVSGFKQHDELGVLADAFVVMSGAIMKRENELREKQRQFEGIIGNAPAVIYMKDPQGRYLLINSLYEKLFSVTSEQMRGKTDSELFDEEYAAQIRANEQRVFETQRPIQVEEVVPQNGVLHTYLSVKFPLFDDEMHVIAVCGISTDITDRKRTESDLMLAKNIIENANEGVVVTTLDGIITDVNEAYEKITGYTREEVLGKTPAINKSGRHDSAFYQAMWEGIRRDGYWQGEIWDRRKNGAIYPKWLSINTVRNERGETSNYVGIFSDITLKKATEEQLEKLAYFDSLTELPNRLLFRDRLSQEIAAARRHNFKVALLFIDLDRFKYVNDNLGHAAGDELLQIVAQRIKETVRDSDTVSRLGGDEFTVIIPDIEHEEQVSGVAQKIIAVLGETMSLRGQAVHIGASIGIAIFPNDGENIDQLNQHADMALYKAKDEGRNNFQYFSHEMQIHNAERIKLEADMRRGIERGEFTLYYQPKYTLATGEISGIESLLRWQQPERGLVSPAEFIPLAEETGLIIPISEIVLRQACMQTAEWNREMGMTLNVAVNLSAKQFAQAELAAVIAGVLDESGLSAEHLELELTESMVMDDVEQAILTMYALRDLGLSLAIDDFGTGYSSLSYLKRFPITTLKIDQSFVRDLTTDSDDASIIQAIIAMARQLQLHVVAEGVETREQLEFLRRHGCEQVQGYLLSRPLPKDSLEALLRQGPVPFPPQ